MPGGGGFPFHNSFDPLGHELPTNQTLINEMNELIRDALKLQIVGPKLLDPVVLNYYDNGLRS